MRDPFLKTHIFLSVSLMAAFFSFRLTKVVVSFDSAAGQDGRGLKTVKCVTALIAADRYAVND